MKLRSLTFGSFGILLAALSAHAATTCESLKSLSLENTTIDLAQTVAAGEFAVPANVPNAAQQNAVFKQLPAFCRLAATLRPTNDSDIKIEVWMPLANWNGKFQAVGNGGWGGVISYSVGNGGIERGLAQALERGYATASTDTGHVGGTAAPMMGHPEKLVDFGYRAVHEMTVKSKMVINAFYGAGPKLAYWNACSTGGRQGLMEAQRFPGDYDGMIAGAPANPATRLSTWNVYIGQENLRDPANTIPVTKYLMIHQAVMNTCDALDGLKDDLIGDPSRCKFDFKSLQCQGADSSLCLTSPQVESARKITSPTVHSQTREMIFPGLALGTELGWAGKAGGPEPTALGTDYFKYAVFQNSNWDWRSFSLERDVALADKMGGDSLNAVNPDLTAFRQHGGKLLLFHGWSDQNFSAMTTINYYKSVLDKMGSGPQTANWLRLFLLPGMGHCGGGEGPNSFDPVTALENWVEHGKAPAQIIATHRTDGKVDRTRPLCPYPQVAKYKGSGSTDDAANFVCKAP